MVDERLLPRDLKGSRLSEETKAPYRAQRSERKCFREKLIVAADDRNR